MKTIYAKHLPYDDGHLGPVIEVMKEQGPPIIRCVRHDGDLFALEGSHRLSAAKVLGKTVILLEETPDGASELDDFWKRARIDLPIYEIADSPIFSKLWRFK